MKARVRCGLFYVFGERLYMISQQKTGFSASPFMKGVDNGLVRFNYLAHFAGDLSDHRADPEVKRQRIPYAIEDVIPRCSQDSELEINVVFHARIWTSAVHRHPHISSLSQHPHNPPLPTS